MSTASDSVELLTIAEAAKLLRVSVSSVQRLQQRRLLPFIKVGGRVRFAMSDLSSFVADNRVEAIGKK
jgi:excisionase family DNA binding protein